LHNVNIQADKSQVPDLVGAYAHERATWKTGLNHTILYHLFHWPDGRQSGGTRIDGLLKKETIALETYISNIMDKKF
jgi:hypothetical protein